MLERRRRRRAAACGHFCLNPGRGTNGWEHVGTCLHKRASEGWHRSYAVEYPAAAQLHVMDTTLVVCSALKAALTIHPTL